MEDIRVARLRGFLGLSNAPLVNSNLATTLTFFRDVLHQDAFGWTDYLRGIDFHRSVSSPLLRPSTGLSRHRSTTPGRPKPFVYLTKPGTSPYSTGTSFPNSVFERFETTVPTPALQSYAASIRFPRTDESRIGGGLQYIVSLHAFGLLRPVR